MTGFDAYGRQAAGPPPAETPAGRAPSTTLSSIYGAVTVVAALGGIAAWMIVKELIDAEASMRLGWSAVAAILLCGLFAFAPTPPRRFRPSDRMSAPERRAALVDAHRLAIGAIAARVLCGVAAVSLTDADVGDWQAGAIATGALAVAESALALGRLRRPAGYHFPVPELGHGTASRPSIVESVFWLLVRVSGGAVLAAGGVLVTTAARLYFGVPQLILGGVLVVAGGALIALAEKLRRVRSRRVAKASETGCQACAEILAGRGQAAAFPSLSADPATREPADAPAPRPSKLRPALWLTSLVLIPAALIGIGQLVYELRTASLVYGAALVFAKTDSALVVAAATGLGLLPLVFVERRLAQARPALAQWKRGLASTALVVVGHGLPGAMCFFAADALLGLDEPQLQVAFTIGAVMALACLCRLAVEVALPINVNSTPYRRRVPLWLYAVRTAVWFSAWALFVWSGVNSVGNVEYVPVGGAVAMLAVAAFFDASYRAEATARFADRPRPSADSSSTGGGPSSFPEGEGVPDYRRRVRLTAPELPPR